VAAITSMASITRYSEVGWIVHQEMVCAYVCRVSSEISVKNSAIFATILMVFVLSTSYWKVGCSIATVYMFLVKILSPTLPPV